MYSDSELKHRCVHPMWPQFNPYIFLKLGERSQDIFDVKVTRGTMTILLYHGANWERRLEQDECQQVGGELQ